MFAKIFAKDIHFHKLFLLSCLVFIFAIFLVIPLLILFTKAFFAQDGEFVGFRLFIEYFSSPNMVVSLTNTIEVAATSTLISVSFGFVFAFCISRHKVWGQRVLKSIALLPMLAPTMLFGLALIYLMGNKGILTQLGLPFTIYGKLGIIIAEAIYCFPIAVIIMQVAFTGADQRLYDAANAMGAGFWRRMMTITLPNVKYGLINASFVCFTYSFTDFGAPSIVGGNYSVLATDIYKQVIGQQNFNMGAVVGIFMMLPTVISVIVNTIIAKKQTSAISSKSTPYVITPHPKSDALATAFCLFVAAGLAFFFLTALYGSLVTSWPYNLDLTLKHYDFTAIGGSGGFATLWRTIEVSLWVAFLGTALSFVTAYCVEKFNVFPVLRKSLYFFSIAPNAIPGTVIGISFVFFFNTQAWPIPFTDLYLVNGFNSIYGTVAILVAANIVHYFAVPFITALTALKRLDREFETVSESLNVPLYRTFFKVTLPISWPAISEMVLYYFINSMITVSAVIFLYTPMTRLASIVILNVRDAGDDAQATALCLLLVVINLLVRFVYKFIHLKALNSSVCWSTR